MAGDAPKTTVCVWAEDEDKSGVETGLASLADREFIVSGDSVTQPSDMPYIVGLIAGTEFSTYVLTHGRLESPGLGGKNVNNYRIYNGPSGVSQKYDTMENFWENPLKGVPGQQLTAYSLEADEAGVAHVNWIAAFFANQRLPMGRGNPPITHILNGTLGAIAAALTWEAKDITLRDSLPSGKYRVWGADLVSATAIAARILGLEDAVRPPGFIPRRSVGDAIHPHNMRIGGSYPYTMEYRQGGSLPLKIEYCALTTDTALNLKLFLQKIG